MSVQTHKIATRNPMAGLLAHGSNQPKIVRARKGKGSYRRTEKHRGRAWN